MKRMITICFVSIILMVSYQLCWSYPRIMPLGDSITDGLLGSDPPSGYRDNLAEKLEAAGIYFKMVGTVNDGTDYYPKHEGHWGWRADEIDAQISDWLSGEEPNVVLLHIGTNDVSQYQDNDETILEIESILDKIYDYDPETPILFCSIIPRIELPGKDRDIKTVELNELIFQLYVKKMNEGLNIYFVDQYNAFVENENWAEDYMWDRVHPREEGYEVMAQTYFDVLINVLDETVYSISGNISYYANNDPMQDITVNITGTKSYTNTTDTEGDYSFYNLLGGDYTIQPQKESIPNSENTAVIMYSAALTLRHALGMENLSSLAQIAADADRNGQIVAYDAALIARYVVGLSPLSNDHVGEWIFDPEQRNYNGLDEDKQNQDFTAVLIGDVAGQWEATGLPKKLTNFESISQIEISSENIVSIPINIYEKELLSFEGIIEFPAHIFKFEGIDQSEKLKDFATVSNIQNGKIHFGAFSAQPVDCKNEVIILKFSLLNDVNKDVPINIEKFQVNNYRSESKTAVVNLDHKNPYTFKLFENYPNPFNPSTTISYQIPESGNVKLIIYNSIGQEVKTLLNEEQSAGIFEANWNGDDKYGYSVANGIYIYRIIFNNQVISKSMLKLE